MGSAGRMINIPPLDVLTRIVSWYCRKHCSSISRVAGVDRSFRRNVLSQGDFFERFMRSNECRWSFVVAEPTLTENIARWEVVLVDGVVSIECDINWEPVLRKLLDRLGVRGLDCDIGGDKLQRMHGFITDPTEAALLEHGTFQFC